MMRLVMQGVRSARQSRVHEATLLCMSPPGVHWQRSAARHSADRSYEAHGIKGRWPAVHLLQASGRLGCLPGPSAPRGRGCGVGGSREAARLGRLARCRTRTAAPAMVLEPLVQPLVFSAVCSLGCCTGPPFAHTPHTLTRHTPAALSHRARPSAPCCRCVHVLRAALLLRRQPRPASLQHACPPPRAKQPGQPWLAGPLPLPL